MVIDDRNSLKSGFRRASQKQLLQQQQQQQQQQQSIRETKSNDAMVPFSSVTGKVWGVTEEKDHSMNNQIVTIVPTSLSPNPKTAITTMLDDDTGEHDVDVHFVYGEKKKNELVEDNDDDIGILIRLARDDVIRNHEYIQLATEDMNRALVRLDAAKRDAQLAVERLQQLKKLSIQIANIPNKHDNDSVVQVQPLPLKTSSKSTLATGRNNSTTSYQENDHDPITDGGSDPINSQQQSQQQQSQQQTKRTVLGRKRNSSKPGEPP